jgi:hypothetical protein
MGEIGNPQSNLKNPFLLIVCLQVCTLLYIQMMASVENVMLGKILAGLV